MIASDRYLADDGRLELGLVAELRSISAGEDAGFAAQAWPRAHQRDAAAMRVLTASSERSGAVPRSDHVGSGR